MNDPLHAPLAALHPSVDGWLRLDALGLLRAQGEDAARFLHGQLTQDFALLGLDQARLAAYCSPKGRMLASFVAFKRAPDDILLIGDRSVLAPTLKRLSMFVLRAKVRLSDASDSFRLLGLVGASADQAVAPVPWSLLHDGEAHTVRLWPADLGVGLPVARALRCQPLDAAEPDAPPLAASLWAWLEVRSGVAPVTAPLAEALVPQMLNYESVDGVNFKKGCYPGQEVVARSQFRGTLKRRAYVVRAAAPLTVGQAVFQAHDPDQPCGVVAAAAQAPNGVWEGIASLQIAAADAGGLHLDRADGAELHTLALPYPLRQDI